jgi:regulator of replication initiation timing
LQQEKKMADEQTLENENQSDLSPEEVKAMDKGWVPQDEWEGEPDQWRPAKEFLDRGELMDRISSQSRQLDNYNKEIKELQVSMKALAEHNKKVAKLEYDKAMKDLKSKKAEALSYGDHDTVVDIDEQIDDLKTSKREIETQEDSAPNTDNMGAAHPSIVAWMEENTWYNTNPVMRGAADALADAYVAQNPHIKDNPDAVLSYVNSAMRKEFPDRFGAPKRKPSGTADTSTSGSASSKGGKKKFTSKDLSQEQRTVAKRFAATGVMTEQEYVDQLVELGEVQ